VTREGQICSWNQAAERLFGYRAAEVLNRACYEVLDGHGALGTHVCIGDCSVQQCAAQKMEIPDFDLDIKKRSGERLWVNVSTLVFDEPRRNRHLIVHLARDISCRK
jgi:PAS domain S-box-containing protein